MWGRQIRYLCNFFAGHFGRPGRLPAGVSAGVPGPDRATLCSRIRVENHWEPIGAIAGRRASREMGPRTAQGRGRNQDQVAAADGQRVFHVPVKTQAAPCGLPFPLTPMTARRSDDACRPLKISGGGPHSKGSGGWPGGSAATAAVRRRRLSTGPGSGSPSVLPAWAR